MTTARYQLKTSTVPTAVRVVEHDVKRFNWYALAICTTAAVFLINTVYWMVVSLSRDTVELWLVLGAYWATSSVLFLGYVIVRVHWSSVSERLHRDIDTRFDKRTVAGGSTHAVATEFRLVQHAPRLHYLSTSFIALAFLSTAMCVALAVFALVAREYDSHAHLEHSIAIATSGSVMAIPALFALTGIFFEALVPIFRYLPERRYPP